MPGSVAEPTANEWTTLEYVASTTYDYKFPEARLSVLSLNINEGGGRRNILPISLSWTLRIELRFKVSQNYKKNYMVGLNEKSEGLMFPYKCELRILILHIILPIREQIQK